MALAALLAGCGESGPVLTDLAVYDGTTWSSLGGASPDSSVSTILVGGGETCVGGMFTSIGGTRPQNVACWNGTAWTAYDLPEAFYEVKVLARQSGDLPVLASSVHSASRRRPSGAVRVR